MSGRKSGGNGALYEVMRKQGRDTKRDTERLRERALRRAAFLASLDPSQQLRIYGSAAAVSITAHPEHYAAAVGPDATRHDVPLYTHLKTDIIAESEWVLWPVAARPDANY